MKLAGDEEKIAQYYFDNKRVDDCTAILTNRRLIIVYRSEEQSYPLSKITAVKVVEENSGGMLVAGIAMVITGLLLIQNNPLGALVLVAIGAGLVYLAWKGKTRLVISHMGGQQDYTVSGQDDPKLKKFINAVNGKLA